MRTAGAANWSEADEEQLRDLWLVQGLSSGDIAWIMSRTRNAIIGKINRLGLAGRMTKVQPKIKPKAPPRRQPRKKSNAVLHILRRAKPAVEPRDRAKGANWAALPSTVPVDLLSLEAGMCKWPIGDDKPFLFCGAATDGVYCEHHHSISAGLGTEEERAADETLREAA